MKVSPRQTGRRLQAAFLQNPRIQPLVEGLVPLEGYDLIWNHGPAGRLHQWHLTENACDLFEFSLANLLITRGSPDLAHLRWMAVPTFLSKAAMWLKFFVHEQAGIESFADLRGKRVGVPDFHMTAAVWMRIVLRELYGIGPEDISWVNGRDASATHGHGVSQGQLKPGIEFESVTEGQTLNGLLHAGKIDAAFGDSHSALVSPGAEVRRFPADVGRRVFADFHAATGMTPTNHVLVVQQKMIDDDPGFPMLLFDAFEESKQLAYRRARREAAGYLVLAETDFARNAADFGEDPYPRGMAANRRMVQTIADEMLDEGLLSQPVTLDSVFAAATLDT